ncbi:MAG: YraN family protein [Sphingomonadales bacterium]
MTQDRQRRERKGRRAETLAAWYLRLKGYAIIEHRYKSPVGEIDLIARRGNTLVFVEVKARKTVDLALEAITPHQQTRILRAAHYFISQNPAFAHAEQRVDALCLAAGRWPVHMHDICPA